MTQSVALRPSVEPLSLSVCVFLSSGAVALLPRDLSLLSLCVFVSSGAFLGLVSSAPSVSSSVIRGSPLPFYLKFLSISSAEKRLF